MKRNYYFLASSLAELARGKARPADKVRDMVEFFSSQLHADDLESLKTLFLFNDIKNLVAYHREGDPFVYPSYYSAEELTAGRADPERLLPFIRDYLSGTPAGTPKHPDFLEINDLVTLFYEHLGDIRDGFVREYFLHELNLRNVAVALELRGNNVPFTGKLIPLGEAYEQVVADGSEDFGLSETFPFMRRLLPPYREANLTRREETIEDIRWDWLDERLGPDFFSTDFVLSFAIKLLSVERWEALSPEKGEELFSELLDTVRRSVRFAIEFSSGEESPQPAESDLR